MDADDVEPAPVPPEYASTCIDSGAGRDDAGADVDLEFNETGVTPWAAGSESAPVEERLGLAVLRLRLYRGWSQAMLERVSGVDQTLISRFERGKVPGLAMRRLYAMLKALRTEEITFGPGERLPQSSWEDAMYGDLWERAGRVAEARVNRRRSA